MKALLAWLGRALARYLSQPNPRYQPITTTDPESLAATLRPGDVLLVEGNTRFSTAIKYLTQSTWSHAALYVGAETLAKHPLARPQDCLIKADVVHGVVAVPLANYAGIHTRICRPVGLTDADKERVIQYAIARLGHTYDLKNVIDLARYLLPTPPVPVRWRRELLALGSGDPTKAICSTLIAQAFEAIRYPILPKITTAPLPGVDPKNCVRCRQEILHIRHHSLFTPRDFDLSPYFKVVKPTMERGFDYTALVWRESDVTA